MLVVGEVWGEEKAASCPFLLLVISLLLLTKCHKSPPTIKKRVHARKLGKAIHPDSSEMEGEKAVLAVVGGEGVGKELGHAVMSVVLTTKTADSIPSTAFQVRWLLLFLVFARSPTTPTSSTPSPPGEELRELCTY